jgi:preprotein translocase subunit SecD
VFSLFTAVFITRFFVDVIVEQNLVTDQKAYGA